MKDNKKTIWIINHYATTEFKWKSGRPYSLSKYLKLRDYNVVVFCASTLHSTGEEILEINDGDIYREIIDESKVPFVFVKTRPYKNNGKQRVLNIIDFYRRVKKTCYSYSKKNGAPDVVIGSSAHILNCVSAIKIAKKYGCKSITEIRDLWPESFVAYGILKPNNIITRILRHIEKWCYIKSNRIIFTMENAYSYIQEQGWEKKIPYSKVDYVNNGVDLQVFNYNKEHYQIDDEDLNNQEIFKVIYTGSIRKVNNIGLLVDAAKLISDKKVKILIWGLGNELDELKDRVYKENIKNVVFKGSVEKEKIPYIISKADLNILHNSDTPIMKYGLSLNKMFDYAAACRPILTDFGKYCNPLLNYGAAISTEDNSKESIAKGIMSALHLSDEDWKRLCEGAKKCSYEYDYKLLTDKLIMLIEDIISK